MPPVEQSRDTKSEFIAEAQAGDVNAFSQLMEEVQPRLLARAIAFCKDPEQARDLVQETMVAAWKSLKRFDGTCQLFTWLYVILLRQHRRAAGWFTRRIPVATPSQLESAPRHEESTARESGGIGADESAILRSMVSSLPQKHQDVIRLRIYAEATEAETAAALGISPGTVKSRLHNALQKLRRMKEKLNSLRPEQH